VIVALAGAESVHVGTRGYEIVGFVLIAVAVAVGSLAIAKRRSSAG
jgi:hypothetical protein